MDFKNGSVMVAQRGWYRAILAILLTVVLLALAPASGEAAAEPKTKVPGTYHYQANLVIAIAQLAISAEATGDYDVENNAFHVKAISGSGAQQSTVELILVNDRLYLYNPERERWEYVAVPTELRGSIISGPVVPVHPTAAYRSLGDETIASGATTHWQARGDYNILVPQQTTRALGGAFSQEVVTADAYIGTTNTYLSRVTLEERGTIQDLNDRTHQKTPILSNIVYNYSAFDRPVTITAPEGAVPADTDTPSPDPLGPLASIAASFGLDGSDPYGVKAIALLFAPGLIAAP